MSAARIEAAVARARAAATSGRAVAAAIAATPVPETPGLPPALQNRGYNASWSRDRLAELEESLAAAEAAAQGRGLDPVAWTSGVLRQARSDAELADAAEAAADAAERDLGNLRWYAQRIGAAS